MTLSDIEWLSKIFHDKKRRAVSAIAELLVVMADGILSPYNVARGSGIMILNSPDVRLFMGRQ